MPDGLQFLFVYYCFYLLNGTHLRADGTFDASLLPMMTGFAILAAGFAARYDIISGTRSLIYAADTMTPAHHFHGRRALMRCRFIMSCL